jgi:hypothetical protein
MFLDHRPVGRYPRCVYCNRRFDLHSRDAWWHMRGVCIPAPTWHDRPLAHHVTRELLGVALAMLAVIALLALITR